jgi:predicted RNA methylase
MILSLFRYGTPFKAKIETSQPITLTPGASSIVEIIAPNVKQFKKGISVTLYNPPKGVMVSRVDVNGNKLLCTIKCSNKMVKKISMSSLILNITQTILRKNKRGKKPKVITYPTGIYLPVTYTTSSRH